MRPSSSSLIPLVGALSDRVGRRPLYLTGAVGVGVWSFVFFGLLDSESRGKILLAVVVGLFLHSLMYAPQAAFFSELFGTSVRYTGASVGYQLASIFAGALAPIIAVKLLGSATAATPRRSAIYVDHRLGDHDHRGAASPRRPGHARCATTGSSAEPTSTRRPPHRLPDRSTIPDGPPPRSGGALGLPLSG